MLSIYNLLRFLANEQTLNTVHLFPMQADQLVVVLFLRLLATGGITYMFIILC